MSPKGNYYSLRSQHEKAALYFQRALKLNPRCLGAWTLMGHEYMEMKNTSAAIQAYRSAWNWNHGPLLGEFHPSSAWSFLSISDMPSRWTSVTTVPGMAWVKHMRSSGCHFTVCIIIGRLTNSGMLNTSSPKHNTVALQWLMKWSLFYRPNDSRMLVALGESYEKLSQQAEAKKVG